MEFILALREAHVRFCESIEGKFLFATRLMFQLSKEEFDNLRSQLVTSSWGGTRYLPYAFTEQGVSMLSSVLKSKRAIYVNIQIMRAFVKLRKLLKSNKGILRKIENMEKRYDSQFKIVFDAIRQLMTSTLTKQDRVIKGFRP